MIELKPCPFCGGTHLYIDGYDHASGKRWRVVCLDCMATVDDGTIQQKFRAIEAWNRRAQPENKPLTRCENCTHWDKSISFMGAHACAYWSPSRKEPRYTEWFEFCSFAEAKPERSEG